MSPQSPTDASNQGANGFRTTSDIFQTSVLIVGGGPTGLTSAILLANHGIRSISVERHVTTLDQPKAHAINPRSLEILRQAGLDTKQLRSLGESPHDADMVRFATSMVGLELGHLPYERQWKDSASITPEPLFNISQPKLQEFLVESVSKSQLISLWKGVQFESSSNEDSNGHQTSYLLDRKTSRSITVHSKYVLLCDGANSRSRAKFQVSFDVLPGHPDIIRNHVSVHFKTDLSKMKSGTLWFFMAPSQQGTLICYNRKSSWVYVFNIDPNVTPTETITDTYCRSMIDEAIGDSSVSYEIQTITHWKTRPCLASTYRSPTHPNTFLLGDAAHVFPPTGGLGVNTGIADAHNLIWKISMLESGVISPSFLDTYTSERRPIAIANAEQSAKNQVEIYKLLSIAERLDFATSTKGGTCTVEEWGSAENAPMRTQVEEAIKANSEHFDSINLQIGYVYGTDDDLDVRKDDGHGRIQPDESSSVPCNIYTPVCVRGVRMPHAWIRREGKICSSLDLVDGKNFTVFESEGWCQGDGSTPNENASYSVEFDGFKVPLKTMRLGKDFRVEDDSHWAEIMGIDRESSAVIIRPDHHVLGRVGCIHELVSTLKKYLGY